MGKIKFTLLFIAMLTGGAIGGMIFSFFSNNIARADASSEIVRARLIQLVDEKGILRASLGFSEDQSPVFAFYDKGGKIASYFGQTSHGGVINFKDHSGETKLYIWLDENELPGMYLFEGASKISASMSITANKQPMLALTDSNGKPCLMAGLERDSQPTLILKSRAGGNQSALYSHPRLGPGLFLMDSQGKANKAYTTKGIVDADDIGSKELGGMMMR